MHILDPQDAIIRKVFPGYDRAKSSILMEFGNYLNCDFIAKVYRKGTHRFEMSGGELVSYKRVK